MFVELRWGQWSEAAGPKWRVLGHEVSVSAAWNFLLDGTGHMKDFWLYFNKMRNILGMENWWEESYDLADRNRRACEGSKNKNTETRKLLQY